ncbi:MAG: 16S rRNA (cytidine(1402)-2'-O)-methyltransferase [Thermodesulfovibrionales bacterium]|nr:16S rRNA (cytidine(1402)-2'-O)-methyltransferase [Thermodesulfovibrionales bacterium]
MNSKKSQVQGTLFVVATPIGNLEDITLRALRVLKEVDFIAVEDTRHSMKLLNYYNISKPLISYWSEKEKIRAEQIIKRLKAGQSCALISDAGTPGISDPGALLIKKAIEEDISIIAIPGPSGVISALSISGLPTDEFLFVGFLPSDPTGRRKKLQKLAVETRTLIFYEAPHRLLETLKDIKEFCGDRDAVVVKELTKLYEEILRGRLTDLIMLLENRKIAGEFIILIRGAERQKVSFTEALNEVKLLMKRGIGRKEAVKRVADDYGLSKKELYDKSIAIDNQSL